MCTLYNVDGQREKVAQDGPAAVGPFPAAVGPFPAAVGPFPAAVAGAVAVASAVVDDMSWPSMYGCV